MNRNLCIVMLVCLLGIVTGNSYAQPAVSIRGRILTSDGQPVPEAAVLLLETKQLALSDKEGVYVFNKLKQGNYTVKLSVLGLPAIKRSVAVTGSQEQVVDFTLSENAVGLQEVEVTARNRNKLLNKSSGYVAKLPLHYLENPQSYTTISDKLLTEQITTDLSDGLRNAPGIVKMQGSPGRSGDGAIYYNMRGFPTRASMIDGIPGQTNGEIDMANIASVEVIRGPSGTLYGGAFTSFGGLINLVTKKPLDTLGGEVSYTTGTFNLHRVTADVYGPLNNKKNLTTRVNAAYHTRNSFQDAGFRRSFFLAPVIAWEAGKRLKVNVGAEFYSYKGTNTPIIFLSRTREFIAHTPDEMKFDWNHSYTNNDITLKAPATNVHGRVEYKLGRNWTSGTNFSYNTCNTDGIYQYQFVRGKTDDPLERNVQLQDSKAATLSIQQNFNGEFYIGSVRNRLLLGLDYLNQTADNNNSPIVKYDTISGSNPDMVKYRSLTQQTAMDKITKSTAAYVRNHMSSNTYSAYAADVVNFTPNLLAMVSLRVDYFESGGTKNLDKNGELVPNSKYSQTALSPKFGVVYQPLPGRVSLFANYMNGFSNVQPVTQPLPDISGNFKPQYANQLEGGVKLDLLDGRLTFTGSYYDIKVDNITRDASITVNGNEYTITVQDGTQKSKGVELELMAAPVAGLSVVAGYTYNDSKLEKTSKALEGRRPPSAGPANIANAWISYTLQKGWCKGLGAGIGGNYASDHMTVNTATTGIFTFPSYTLLNATLFYDAHCYRAGLKFDNITNQVYFAGQGVIVPQMPFSISANMAVKF